MMILQLRTEIPNAFLSFLNSKAGHFIIVQRWQLSRNPD